jgi:hypothetical protein
LISKINKKYQYYRKTISLKLGRVVCPAVRYGAQDRYWLWTTAACHAKKAKNFADLCKLRRELFDRDPEFEGSFPPIGFLTLNHYDVIVTSHGGRNLAAVVARHVGIVYVLAGRVGYKDSYAVIANLFSVERLGRPNPDYKSTLVLISVQRP